MSVRSNNSKFSKASYMEVASFTQQIGKREYIDYKQYMRRVSKYDIDRNSVDLHKLNKEKERDRTDNVKIKKSELEDQVYT